MFYLLCLRVRSLADVIYKKGLCHDPALFGNGTHVVARRLTSNAVVWTLRQADVGALFGSGDSWPELEDDSKPGTPPFCFVFCFGRYLLIVRAQWMPSKL